MTLLIELKIAVLKLRIAWWRWAERSMGPSHVDIPMAMRTIWGLHQRIKDLEARRGR
jgi:hypothetical protein